MMRPSLVLSFSVLPCATVALWLGANAWDDGAITLAYARTLVDSGRHALTPVSEVAEGYSSTLWMLANAALRVLFALDFHDAIAASQLLCALCMLSVALSLYRLSVHHGLTRGAALFLGWAFMLSGPVLQEVANGMEMGLLAAAACELVRRLELPRPSAVAVAALSALMLATRFEALFYLGVVGAALLLRGDRRSALLVLASASVSFALLELHRLLVFHSPLPATVFAKTHLPYSHQHLSGRISTRVKAGLEALAYVLPAVLATAYLVRRRVAPRALLLRLTRSRELLPASLIVGAFAFSLLIGKNWGYFGRMQLFALPSMLLLSFVLVARAARASTLPRAGNYAAFVGVGATVLASELVSGPHEAIEQTLSGGGTGVSPECYRRTADAVMTVRKALGQETIGLLTPDVGGTALCCPQIRITDLGLLTHPDLARLGYPFLATLIARERPEVLELHGFWAVLPDAYRAAWFSDYVPAVVKRSRFFLRRDVAERLIATRHGDVVQPASSAEARRLITHPHICYQDDWSADIDQYLSAPAVLFLPGLTAAPSGS